MVAWHCVLGLATVNAPFLGLGGGTLGGRCASECVRGKRLVVHLTSVLLGGSAGPLPAGGSAAEADLADSMAAPSSLNLQGLASIATFGFTAPLGASCTTITLGSAHGSMACGAQGGVDLGADAYTGVSIIVGSDWECCE